jgi:hypothetical protein
VVSFGAPQLKKQNTLDEQLQIKKAGVFYGAVRHHKTPYAS